MDSKIKYNLSIHLFQFSTFKNGLLCKKCRANACYNYFWKFQKYRHYISDFIRLKNNFFFFNTNLKNTFK